MKKISFIQSTNGMTPVILTNKGTRVRTFVPTKDILLTVKARKAHTVKKAYGSEFLIHKKSPLTEVELFDKIPDGLNYVELKLQIKSEKVDENETTTETLSKPTEDFKG